MSEVYTQEPRVGRASVIEAAKEAVPVEDLAERLSGPGTRRGRESAFICPLHDDHDPSMTVTPDKGLWYCFPCGVGGDVVSLAQRAWKIERADEAAAFLLLEFDHPIPQRPPAWFARQERQAPIRAKTADVRTEVLMRRLFRFVFEPMISAVEGPDERAEMAADLWRDVLPLAARLVEDRRRQA